MIVFFRREALFVLAFLLVPNTRAFAQPGFAYSIDSKSFVNFDLGRAPLGINDVGQLVGEYPLDGSLPVHAFIKNQNVITDFDFPGAYFTSANGINNAAQIVGNRCSLSSNPPYGIDCAGFMKNGNTFTSYVYPGALFTYANAINNTGQVVGKYRVEVAVGPHSVQDFDHGLVVENNVLTAFDFPGAYSTEATSVNDAAEIVGTYVELITSWPGFRYRGFLKQGDTFSSIDYPGVLFTFVNGINNFGHVVGGYQDKYGFHHGFIKDGHQFTSFDVPGADTFPSGINNSGHVIGMYYPRPVVNTVNTLIAQVSQLGLPHGTTNSLVTQLQAAIAAFGRGDLPDACANIGNFIHHVNAQARKKISSSVADALIAAGQRIQAMLGC